MKDNSFVLLGNYNDLEADIIESILQQLDIPVLRKYPDSGGYMEVYAGISQFGVSIYVPESELDKAREVIAGKLESASEEIWNEEELSNEDEYETSEDIERESSLNSIFKIFPLIVKGFIVGFFLYYLVVYIIRLF